MDLKTIRARYKTVIKPDYGTVTPDELDFIQSLIARHRPARFIEVGMASGLSTGFIACFLEENGGRALLSLDHDDQFFGDPSKPNGFLVPELYRGAAVDVDLVKHRTTLDIQEFEGSFDMAFVDANHQQPWPALDMMALYPRMSGPRIMIHHDLQLYRNQDVMFGIGPKYLYDQFPDSHRERSSANHGNIFAVDLNLDQGRFETLLTDLFKLPWSLRTPLSPAYTEKIRTVLRRDYAPALLAHFDECLAIQNAAYGPPPPPPEPGAGTAPKAGWLGRLVRGQ